MATAAAALAVGRPDIAAYVFGLLLAYALAGPYGVTSVAVITLASASAADPDVKRIAGDLRWFGVGAMAAIPWVLGRRVRLRRDAFAVGGYVLLAFCLASTAWSALPSLTFQRVAALALVFYVSVLTAPALFSTEHERLRLLKWLTVLLIGGCALAIVMGITIPGTSRPVGPLRGWLENSNTMGLWAACLLPAIYVAGNARWRLLLAALPAAVIVWSSSRAALGVLLGVAIIALPVSRHTKAAVATAIVALGLLIAVTPVKEVFSGSAVDKFSSTGGTVRALTGARSEAWQVTYDLWRIAPLEGLGFGTGDRVFALTGQDRRFLYYQGDTAGSSYLTSLLETGAIGASLLLMTLILATRTAARRRAPNDETFFPLFGLGVAVAAAALVESILLSPGNPFSFLAFLGLGVASVTPAAR